MKDGNSFLLSNQHGPLAEDALFMFLDKRDTSFEKKMFDFQIMFSMQKQNY